MEILIIVEPNFSSGMWLELKMSNIVIIYTGKCVLWKEQQGQTNTQ